MSQKITDTDLDTAASILSRMIAPNENPERFHISRAYGGNALSDNRGDTDIFRSGHVSKRELHAMLSAAITGAELLRLEYDGTQCPQCSRRVAQTRFHCPGCGHRLRSLD